MILHNQELRNSSNLSKKIPPVKIICDQQTNQRRDPMKQYNYTGKIVYVGIDVHKKTYSCVAICEGQIVKRDTMPAKPEILISYLKNKFSGAAKINTAYEAGFSGFHLHRYLISQGINNIVVHPGSIEVASRDRVKTDKRDALKIAKQLAAGRLRGIYVPTQEREEKRSITRLRSSILKLRHQVGNQFKALLFTQGLIDMEDDTVICEKWLSKKLHEIEKSGYSKDFCYSVNQYAQQWIQLNKRMKEVEKRLEVQASEDINLQQIYESAPGIGLIHGRQLANELDDMKQFNNEKQLFSFTGLTPSEHSSGEHVRHGHITRQGSSILRKILIEASWVAIYQDPSLEEIFNRLACKRGKRRAIVGVARRLIGRIRACVLTGTLYEIKSTQEACSLHKKVA
ncbi:MAG TPA: IS110 family transposase [Candidatus Babeliaceae bacterium]|nr:IS110 family transposase [Candidatus Babeliaceae bacterium]